MPHASERRRSCAGRRLTAELGLLLLRLKAGPSTWRQAAWSRRTSVRGNVALSRKTTLAAKARSVPGRACASSGKRQGPKASWIAQAEPSEAHAAREMCGGARSLVVDDLVVLGELDASPLRRS